MERELLADQVRDHVEALRREGELLADVAEATPLDTALPTCPDWQLRDLVRHIGGVHRWASTNVRERRTEPMSDEEQAAIMNTWPADPGDAPGLLGWFRDGHVALVEALLTADPDADYFHFLPAPSGTAFWARRQAHETAIHRVDAESTRAEFSAFSAPFAADGIDELLRGFAARGGRKLRGDRRRTLGVRATDAPRTWLVTMSPDGVEVGDDPAGADCTVVGHASEVYLLLWNRLGRDAVEVAGDAGVLDHWRQALRVRWG
ncbi:MAG: maleylpyruvate isomerase family mycothiol-dependent enzyme [Streptosporangiales bacterium]